MGLIEKIKGWAQSDQVQSAAQAGLSAAAVDVFDLELEDGATPTPRAPAPAASSVPNWALPVGVGLAALLVGVAVARR